MDGVVRPVHDRDEEGKMRDERRESVATRSVANARSLRRQRREHWVRGDGDATATSVQANARCAEGDPLRRKLGVARRVEGKVKIYSERKWGCSHPYLTS